MAQLMKHRIKYSFWKVQEVNDWINSNIKDMASIKHDGMGCIFFANQIDAIKFSFMFN